MKQRILFICSHNCCRSQMAEGLVNQYMADRFQAFSAGIEKRVVSPLAIHVMREIDVEILSARSKLLETFVGQQFDYVVTLGDDAIMNCPSMHEGGKRVHMSIASPGRKKGSYEEVMAEFRRVRDDIKERLTHLLEDGV